MSSTSSVSYDAAPSSMTTDPSNEAELVSPPRPSRPSKKSTVEELRGGLEKLGLDSKGKKETLWKRLISAFNRTLSLSAPESPPHSTKPSSSQSHAISSGAQAEILTSSHSGRDQKQKYTSFLCFDVEATCEAGKDFAYPNEIIEFPVVLLQWVEDDIITSNLEKKTSSTINASETQPDAKSMKTLPSNDPIASSSTSAPASVEQPRKRIRRLAKVDTFHSYVRPVWRPRLSDFCTGLTGITQEMVDVAPTFPDVLKRLETWLHSWDLLEDDRLKDAIWVTDGFDLFSDFIPKQLFISPTTPPRYPLYLLGEYLNLKMAVQSVLSEYWRRDQIESKTSGKGPIISRHPEILTFNSKGAVTDDQLINPPKDWPRLTTGRNGKRNHENSGGSGRSASAHGPNFYRTIEGQLEELGLGGFEGRQHSGLDDATNISRILVALADRDILIEPNARLPPAANSKTYPWMGDRPGIIIYDIPQPEITGLMGTTWEGGSKGVVGEGKVGVDKGNVDESQPQVEEQNVDRRETKVVKDNEDGAISLGRVI